MIIAKASVRKGSYHLGNIMSDYRPVITLFEDGRKSFSQAERVSYLEAEDALNHACKELNGLMQINGLTMADSKRKGNTITFELNPA